MRQRTVKDSGGGLRVGSLLRLACNARPDVAIRCGMHGTWACLVGPWLMPLGELWSNMA